MISVIALCKEEISKMKEGDKLLANVLFKLNPSDEDIRRETDGCVLIVVKSPKDIKNTTARLRKQLNKEFG